VRRQELDGGRSLPENGGEVAPVEVRPRGVAGERQWGMGKLSKGLGWAMGGSRWGLRGDQ
jgi:hypothetical protein